MIYLSLFFEFFKIGLFTFGGGYAMIPLIEETVLKFGWLTESQFFDFIGVCESTPGPVAINMATYIGSVQGGIIGSIFATLGVVMPSFIIILLIAAILKNLTDNRYFKAFVAGVKPIIVALILSTGTLLLVRSLGYSAPLYFCADFVSIIIFAVLLVLCFGYKKIAKRKLSTVPLILISAALGVAVSVIFEMIK